MTRSINEIEAMALKAGRGAGLHLGQAEDFARAVALIAQLHPADLDHLPPALENGEAAHAPHVVDALICGETEVTWTGSPVILGYLDRAALDHGTPFTWDGRIARAGGEMPQPNVGPVPVPDHIWSRLDQFARLTYVPATEASRLGAGAGAIDND